MNKNLIKINDILDELKEENCRLKTDLLLANKCIEILSEMKFFLDSIRDKFGETLDSKLIQTLKRLDDRFSAVVACRQPSSVIKIREPKERRVVEKRLSCDWVGCGFATDRQSRLRAHRNYHTGSRPFECRKCGKSFVGRESLRTHEKSHERKVELQIRVKRLRLRKVLASEKTFRCSQCSYSCLSRQSLYEHKVTHRERTLFCEKCGKGFKARKQLRNHVMTHSKDPPFKCPQTDCSAAYRTRKTLKIHLSKHSNSCREFACDWPGCEFSSAHNWVVKRHLKTHTGEKPFACQQCGQRFRRKHALKDHALKHSGEKPFCCDSCPKAFQSRQSLRSHVRVNH